jgi:hypothetical protein
LGSSSCGHRDHRQIYFLGGVLVVIAIIGKFIFLVELLVVIAIIGKCIFLVELLVVIAIIGT